MCIRWIHSAVFVDEINTPFARVLQAAEKLRRAGVRSVQWLSFNRVLLIYLALVIVDFIISAVVSEAETC